MSKLITAYARLTDAELLEYYELRHLLSECQVRALIIVKNQRGI